MTLSSCHLKQGLNFILVTLLVILLLPYTTLRVVLPLTDEILIEKVILKDNTFTVRWIHSVELTPWEEIFKVSNGKIYLEETRFQSFGAGVPDAIGKSTKTENGYVIFSEIHKEMPSLIYGVSPIAKHELILGTVDPTIYELYTLLPADTAVSFKAVRGSLLNRLYQYTKKNILMIVKGCSFFILIY